MSITMTRRQIERRARYYALRAESPQEFARAIQRANALRAGKDAKAADQIEYQCVCDALVSLINIDAPAIVRQMWSAP